MRSSGRGDEIQVAQEIDAHLDLFVGQGLVRTAGRVGEDELDGISFVEGDEVHEVFILAGLLRHEQLGAVGGLHLAELHFVQGGEGGFQRLDFFSRQIVQAFLVGEHLVISDGQQHTGLAGVFRNDAADDLRAGRHEHIELIAFRQLALEGELAVHIQLAQLSFRLGGNLLTELDLDGLTNLTQLSVYGNQLTALDVSDFALTRLDVENTPLTELVLGQQPRLSTLYCYGTKLKELDLSGCPLLAETLQSGTRTEYSSYYRFNKKINNKDCWLYIGKDMICFTDHDGLPIDADHFPDPQFRLYVSRSFDLNRSGTLSAAEIAAAREIGDEDNDYGSLQGIEYLTELEQILIDAAPSLTGVDLRANTRLYSVDFSNCGNLAELHVEGLSALQDLFVEGNRLTELDLTGVTNLINLDVYRNPLSVLDLGEQPELCRLLCYGTQITSLDLRSCPKLLSTLAVGTRTETEDYVQYLTGYSTGWLRVDKDMELIGLGGVPVDAEHFPDSNFRGYVSTNFDKNHSGWLSDKEIAGAQIISCGAEDIETLQGVEYFPELLELACEDNRITALDLSANTGLTSLDCSYNELTQLSLAGLSDLTDLSCEGNPLTELDVTAAEAKATYAEIQAYVLEHTGLRVSCLYIAQVKAKYGIIERECYNKAKTEGNRVPKCPPEKEQAIEEALRHFQMI